MAGASFFGDRSLYYTINPGDAHGSFSVKKNHSAASIGGKSASVRRGSTHNYAKSTSFAWFWLFWTFYRILTLGQ